jgi:hypothetical protein
MASEYSPYEHSFLSYYTINYDTPNVFPNLGLKWRWNRWKLNIGEETLIVEARLWRSVRISHLKDIPF